MDSEFKQRVLEVECAVSMGKGKEVNEGTEWKGREGWDAGDMGAASSLPLG